MSVLALIKEDHPDKIAATAGVDPKYLWNAGDIQLVVDAINERVQRGEFAELQVSPSGVIKKVVCATGKAVIRFIAAMTELHSVQPSENYPGKILILKNFQETSFVLKHLSTSTGVFETGSFYLPNATDLVVKPNETVMFTWSSISNRYEWFGYMPTTADVIKGDAVSEEGATLTFSLENFRGIINGTNLTLIDTVTNRAVSIGCNSIVIGGSDSYSVFSLGFDDPVGNGGATFRNVGNNTELVAWLSEVIAAQTAAENYADGLIESLVGTSPTTLDTIQEITTALQNNPNIVSEILTSLGKRLRFDINNQGLSSTEKANALTNLGIVIADLLNRANHTGSQAISTITGLQNELQCRTKVIALVNNPASTHTGNTNSTVLYTLPIPANTFSVGDRIIIDFSATQTILSSSQFNAECYIDGTPPIEICRFRTSLSTHTFTSGVLSFEVLTGNKLRGRDITITTDYGSSTSNYSLFDFNPTVANNLLFAVKLGNATNTGKIERIKVLKESIV